MRSIKRWGTVKVTPPFGQGWKKLAERGCVDVGTWGSAKDACIMTIPLSVSTGGRVPLMDELYKAGERICRVHAAASAVLKAADD
jgi:hypothetical protein